MKHKISIMSVIITVILTGGADSYFSPKERSGQGSASVDLNILLDKAAEYADRLEGAVFDFVCREEIEENINPALEVKPKGVIAVSGRPNYIPRRVVVSKLKRSLVYDYQCIRKGGKIHERRTLLKENGKEKNIPNASLSTTVFRYGTNIMSPVALFGTRFQSRYEYSVIGEEKIEGRKTVIVDTIPRFEDPKSTNLYGKAWIAVDSGDILKIEWNECRIGHYEIFEERGKKFKRKPRITVRTEFQTEKNGLRFPTKWYIEEAYLTKHGRAFIRSKTTVSYKDFKFFTVEVEVR